MEMEIGIVGKTNVGKSSFFKAATMIDVEISDRVFTTIKPNVGVGYVIQECPCKELDKKCKPKNSQCINGNRMIPAKLWDVAGLIPGAHEGKGLGNQFLNDLVRADVLIHIIDTSGRTDAEGNATEGYDICSDIKFLEDEIDLWFEEVVKRNLSKIKDDKKKIGVLAGIGIREDHVELAVARVGYEPKALAKELRELSKPILIAANKIDLESSYDNLGKMVETFPELTIIPCSAEAEITLRTASKNKIIDYIPGNSSFEIKKELNEEQKKALEFIKKLLDKYNSTGIQECLNKCVFDFLKYIAVYPVENENKFSDKKGNVLPDVYLMPPDSTVQDLAFKIHTDIGKNFIGAVDARTKKRISGDTKLKNGDIIKIQSAAR
jgi:ribosome-binding ATPase YchF (GTP1/OBG family)